MLCVNNLIYMYLLSNNEIVYIIFNFTVKETNFLQKYM